MEASRNMLNKNVLFPDAHYRPVLEKMVKYLMMLEGVFAIVLTGSLARGRAVKGSCIDFCVFLEEKQLKKLASEVKARAKVYKRMGGEVCYYHGEIEGGVE